MFCFKLALSLHIHYSHYFDFKLKLKETTIKVLVEHTFHKHFFYFATMYQFLKKHQEWFSNRASTEIFVVWLSVNWPNNEKPLMPLGKMRARWVRAYNRWVVPLKSVSLKNEGFLLDFDFFTIVGSSESEHEDLDVMTRERLIQSDPSCVQLRRWRKPAPTEIMSSFLLHSFWSLLLL